MEFQLSCSKSWKMMVLKCCTQYASKFGNVAVAIGLAKVSFHSNPKEGQFQRSNYFTIVLISHTSKVMLKILHARLQQYENQELPDIQTGFRKGRTEDQTANIHWIIEKAREFRKNIYFCFIDYTKAFVCITANCRKFWKRWAYQTTWHASWETCMQVRKHQLEQDMEQDIEQDLLYLVPNRKRSTSRLYIVTLLI